MITINRFYYAFIIIMTIFMAASPVLAVEDSVIIHLYDQYNAQLKQLNLAEPMSLIDKGKVFKANKLLKKINIDLLRKYYSKAMNQTNDECYSDSNCRMSDMIGLHVQTMASYRVKSVEKENNKLVKLVIIGINAPGLERKVVVRFVFESGEWKIDRVITGPPSW
jgi:hypothetical protein